jgi:tRNA A64-2'-O-ribosylphosphate transferase
MKHTKTSPFYQASPPQPACFSPRSTLTLPPQSTDGHTGNLSFSLTRLNWHVAVLAASKGGVLLVDATRSATKRFPDALSKTVPIWAAVLNWAVADHREREGAGCDPGWRGGVSLPAWVGANEAAVIDAAVPGWAAALAALQPGIPALAASLHRPLRPLWISRSSPLWALPRVTDLPFVPLICVSASAPLTGHGQRCASLQLDDGDALPCSFSYVPGAGDDEETWAQGLSAEGFWQHSEQLLRAAGTSGLSAAVVAIAAGERHHAPVIVAVPSASGSTAVRALSAVATGLHDLPPAGLRSLAPDAGAIAAPSLPAGGIRWMGASQLGCASFAALHHREALWARAHAVIACSDVAGVAALRELAAPPDASAWLCVPVMRGKVAKASLLTALPAAFAFAGPHLQNGRSVLVLCEDGLESGPALLLALLAGCCEELAVGAKGSLPGIHALPSPRSTITKQGLRRWLALLSAHHPDARPTRALIKQVYAFLRDPAEREE